MMGTSEIIALFQTSALFQVLLGFISLALYSRIFFLITRGTGKVIYLLGLVIFGGVIIKFPAWLVIIFPVLLGLLIIVEIVTRRKQMQFDNVQARFESGGIRRGLTPPETAMILGKPYPLIVAITIINLLEKKILIIENESEQIFSVDERFKTKELSLNHKDRSRIRKREAQKLGVLLHPYEELFLELFEQGAEKPVNENDFGILVKPWIEEISYRIGGYDLAQTREYYKEIIQRQKEILWILLREDWADAIRKFNINPWWLSKRVGDITSWFDNLEKNIGKSLDDQDLVINLDSSSSQVASTLMDDIAKATYSLSGK